MPPLTAQEYADLPEVLTSVEVAAIFDTSEVQVRRWADAGRLPCVKIGRVWRFSRTRLEEMVASGKAPGN